MKLTSFLLTGPIALLLVTGSAAAKDEGKAKGNKAAQASQKAGSEKVDDKGTVKEWKRSTEGHRPQDLNGDGIITRNEWPGNDASFKELDEDGDGALTNRDRGHGAQGGDKRMYERPVNDYKTPKKK